jgi:adenine deaminase
MGKASALVSLMDTALDREAPDLVVRGGRVLNVFTEEIQEADVLVRHGRVAAVVPPGRDHAGAGSVVEADGRYVVPGLIDAHFHIGGSHLPPAELARSLLARGTTTVATDFYEIYTGAGPAGVRAALDEVLAAGLGVLFLPPAHLIGLEDVGTFGWNVSAADMIEMLAWSEAVGIMEPPAAAVLAREPDLLKVLDENLERGMVFAGHAPGQGGAALHAYLATGASSDHESTRAEEALDKLRAGMRPMMREGSAARDLAQLVELVTRFPRSSRYMMFCSDETDPADLVAKGHMDLKVRMAVDAGVPPVVAVQMASINVAEYYGVAGRLGSIAPGRRADFVLVENLEGFRASAVVAGGRLVGDQPGEAAAAAVDAGLTSRVNIPRPFEPADFRLPAPNGDGSQVVARVIGVRDGTLVSEALERSLPVTGGVVLPRPDQDVLRIAVAERHRGSGRFGRGFVEGFGFGSGAVGMTYCHVYQNLMVVGTSDEQMTEAANAVAELGGGIAVVGSDGVLARWALPVVGVMADQPLERVEPAFTEVNRALAAIGCGLASPVLSLSFVALPTIPAYGLTDNGLFDVTGQRFVEVCRRE